MASPRFSGSGSLIVSQDSFPSLPQSPEGPVSINEQFPSPLQESPVEQIPPSPPRDSSPSASAQNPIPVPKWPQKPQTLHRSGIFSALTCAGDLIIILLSCAFFVYGGLLLRYDQVPSTEIIERGKLEDAARYGPTIFPILFTAIVGQAMQSIALWRLERGEQIGTLDQLWGSTSIFATVVTQLKLRALGLVGSGLILLWSFSPLGGQASLRSLSFQMLTDSQSSSVSYLSMNSTWMGFDNEGVWGDHEGDITTGAQTTNAIFLASLLGPLSIKASSLDTWGNVKIPMLEFLMDGAQSDADGWYEVDPAKTVYSSLIGIPTTPLAQDGETSFSMETSYWVLDCPTLNRASGYWLDMFDEGYNRTYSSEWIDQRYQFWELGTDHVLTLGSQIRRAGKTPDPPLRRFFSSSTDDDMDMTWTVCTIKTTYVEAQSLCEGNSCHITKMRNSTSPHPPSAQTFFDFTYGWTSEFISVLMIAGNCNQGTMSPILRYFVNPASPFDTTLTNASVYDVGPTVYSTKLAQIFNSMYLAGMGAGGIVTGGIPETGELPSLLQFKVATSTVKRSREVLAANRPWLTALFVATSIMFLAGVVGLSLELRRRVPDLDMNISSMTRDNPYIRLPPGGSSLDSVERSRLLRNVKIMFGDVATQNKEFGHIAIAAVDGGSVEKLQRDRLYS